MTALITLLSIQGILTKRLQTMQFQQKTREMTICQKTRQIKLGLKNVNKGKKLAKLQRENDLFRINGFLQGL